MPPNSRVSKSVVDTSNKPAEQTLREVLRGATTIPARQLQQRSLTLYLHRGRFFSALSGALSVLYRSSSEPRMPFHYRCNG